MLRERTVEARLSEALLPSLTDMFDELANEAVAEIASQGISRGDVTVRRLLHVKYEGTDSALIVPFGDGVSIAAAFSAAHRSRYGFVTDETTLAVEAVSVEAVESSETVADDRAPLSTAQPRAVGEATVFTDGRDRATPIFDRDSLMPGAEIDGPAILHEATATTVIEPGWRGRVDQRRNLILERVVPLPARSAIGTDADPVMLEIFNNLFMAIAEQMGVALQNTAYSVNIKERLDFSCALFDHRGALIANAPHMPVHLGSMGESVQTIIRSRESAMLPGDAYMLNAPYNGGTHLPDVTVIMPVFDEGGGECLFFVAARGHQADIGGITPGSMPPASRSVDEEGVLIDDFVVVERGRFLERETLELLRSGRYPARNPAQNVGDLKAQVAACERGARELRRLVDHFGLATVSAYMRHVQDNAAESVRRVIDFLADGD
ncbi:MAG: hydantoinase B/oxoprolinase family protein, partial [Stellaceae bacterium]